MRSREQSNPMLVPIGEAGSELKHGVGEATEKLADSIKGLFNVYSSPLDHTKAPKPMPTPFPYTPTPESPQLRKQQELQQQKELRKQQQEQHYRMMLQQQQQQRQQPQYGQPIYQTITQVTTVRRIIGYTQNGQPIYAQETPVVPPPLPDRSSTQGRLYQQQLNSAGISQVYGEGGGMYMQGQGIASSDAFGDGVDRSALFGAASDASSALGQMMHTSKGESFGTGKEGEGSDNVDGVAQLELLRATQALEALAYDLANQRRMMSVNKASASVSGFGGQAYSVNTTVPLPELVIDSTLDIATAASLLLKAATEAQQERVTLDMATAAHNSTPYHPDPVWSNGLISAARYVVATVHHLINTANEVVAGQQPEEALIAAVKAVNGATAQLIAAERVKGDLNGEAHAKLEEAAKGIVKAADALVNLVKSSLGPSIPPSVTDSGNYSLTQEKIRQLEAETRIQQLQSDLERARFELMGMKKQEYAPKNN